jgi:DNA-binding response OmpR family regulator
MIERTSGRMMHHLKHILLAEDDDLYAFILQVAFRRAGIENPVYRLVSHDEVIAYMGGEGRFADRKSYPVPVLFVLALRLPLQDDFKALRWIRAHHEFAHVPIIVLSGTEYNDERGIACRLGADYYNVKPQDFGALVRIAESIRQRWLEHPEHEAAA